MRLTEAPGRAEDSKCDLSYLNMPHAPDKLLQGKAPGALSFQWVMSTPRAQMASESFLSVPSSLPSSLLGACVVSALCQVLCQGLRPQPGLCP